MDTHLPPHDRQPPLSLADALEAAAGPPSLEREQAVRRVWDELQRRAGRRGETPEGQEAIQQVLLWVVRHGDRVRRFERSDDSGVGAYLGVAFQRRFLREQGRVRRLVGTGPELDDVLEAALPVTSEGVFDDVRDFVTDVVVPELTARSGRSKQDWPALLTELATLRGESARDVVARQTGLTGPALEAAVVLRYQHYSRARKRVRATIAALRQRDDLDQRLVAAAAVLVEDLYALHRHR